MSNTTGTYQRYFIKIILIGDTAVGKKSLVNRINNLKSNKNENGLKSFQLKKNEIVIQSMAAEKASPVTFNDEIDSEDEDFEIEKEYKLSFKPTHQSINDFFRINIGNKYKIITVFAFIYDMSNHSSLDKMVLYYQSIAKIMEKGNVKAVNVILGNKSEKKKMLSKEKNEKFNYFLKKNGIPFFEISSKQHFNFHTFFCDLIKTALNDQEEIDKEELLTILNYNQNFPKAERTNLYLSNTNPGVGAYDVDIYSFKNKREMKQSLVGPNRFVKKIFVNKIAPVIKPEDVSSKKKSDKEEPTFNFSMIGNVLMNSSVGRGIYMASKPGELRLREKRSELRKEMNKELKSSFEENLSKLSEEKSKPNIIIDDEDSFNFQRRKNNILRSQSKERKDKRNELLSKQHENYIRLMSSKTEAQSYKDTVITDSYDQQSKIENAKQRYLNILYGNNVSHVIKAEEKIKKRIKTEKYPGPQSYDVRKDLLNPKHGASIVSRKKKKEGEIYNAPYVALKTEFDSIASRLKDGYISYAKRYSPLPKSKNDENKELSSSLEKKFEKYVKNKDKNIRSQYIASFIEKEKLKQKEHEELIKMIRQEEERYAVENQVTENIKYTQVEPSCPMITLKGRYYVENKNNDEGNLHYPSLDYVKGKLPMYSFGKEERFDKEKDDGNKSQLFIDGQFIPPDCEQFSCKQSYDFNEKRLTFEPLNNYPGPGMYNFKGFAQETIEKALKYQPPKPKEAEPEKMLKLSDVPSLKLMTERSNETDSPTNP